MEKGFSLIELLVVLGVVATITLIAAPNAAILISRERAISDANLLHGALQLTRLHAVTTGQPTTIQPIDNSWRNGWRIYTDPSRSMRVESSLKVVAEQGARSSHIAATSTIQDGVHFLPSGRAILQNGGFQAGTFSVCQTGSPKSHDLVISKIGRVRRASETNNPRCANPAP
jgi:type IV fimbrial biogenesis protein FimT